MAFRTCLKIHPLGCKSPFMEPDEIKIEIFAINERSLNKR